MTWGKYYTAKVRALDAKGRVIPNGSQSGWFYIGYSLGGTEVYESWDESEGIPRIIQSIEVIRRRPTKMDFG